MNNFRQKNQNPLKKFKIPHLIKNSLAPRLVISPHQTNLLKLTRHQKTFSICLELDPLNQKCLTKVRSTNMMILKSNFSTLLTHMSHRKMLFPMKIITTSWTRTTIVRLSLLITKRTIDHLRTPSIQSKRMITQSPY